MTTTREETRWLDSQGRTMRLVWGEDGAYTLQRRIQEQTRERAERWTNEGATSSPLVRIAGADLRRMLDALTGRAG